MQKANKIVHGSIKNKIVASDLLDERSKRNFDNEGNQAFINILGPEHKAAQETEDFIKSDPILMNSHKWYEMTREEQWIDHMKKFRRAWELAKQKYFINYKTDQPLWSQYLMGQNMSILNQSMFLLSLENMCDEEQYKKWVPACKNFRIMGCYAQTELGHGSDVPSLETTATFDQETDEFVIHTPSLRAAKWWPGDLGNFSTHAIVYAKLIIGGQKYGVMPFIVQLRSTETFMPLPGIQCGDMGPKMGYNSKNNGWCTFDHVRIPRDQLLMKYTKVDRDGSFSVQGDTRVLYSVMMEIRMRLIYWSGGALLRSLLIALRYSVVRRQFKNNATGREETKILDYQTQQAKLLPLMAVGFAFVCSHNVVLQKYKQLLADIKTGKMDLLDELHHLSSGMKSIYTQTCNDGLMTVRQSTGGAGYTAWSYLPYLIDDFSPCVTFEGDNTVMAQQSVRFLQKLYKRGKKGERMPDQVYQYLSNVDANLSLKCGARASDDFKNIDLIEEALKVCASHQIDTTMKKIGTSNDSKKVIMNHTLALDLVYCTKVHIQYVTVQHMRMKIKELKDANLRQHFENLTALAGLTFLKEHVSLAYDTGYFKKGDRDLLEDAFNQMLVTIRPQAIPLIELYPLSDEVMPTAIGNSYGDIYETHFDWAKNSRLNTGNGNIPKGWMENVMPIIRGKL